MAGAIIRPQRRADGTEDVAVKPRRDKAEKPLQSTRSGLSFTEKHRLQELPVLIEKYEAEITKLTVLMSDPELFTRDPVKFQKATDALISRQAAIDQAEGEWLSLGRALWRIKRAGEC